MAMQTISRMGVTRILKRAPNYRGGGAPERYWLNYDEETDVLYVSFGGAYAAEKSEILADGVILMRQGDEIAGITIPEASRRKEPSANCA